MSPMCTCPCPSTLKASALCPLDVVGNAEVDMRMAVKPREMAGTSVEEERSLPLIDIAQCPNGHGYRIVDTSKRS